MAPEEKQNPSREGNVRKTESKDEERAMSPYGEVT